MPGMFGSINCDITDSNSLSEYFRQVWGDIKISKHKFGIMGAHSYGKYPAIFEQKDKIIAVDGEISIYENAFRSHSENNNVLFNEDRAGIELTSDCKGNIAVFDNNKNVLYLGIEISGGLPLYYFQNKDSFIFSSLLRPIKNILEPHIDYVGIVEFLRSGYFLAGRTFFKEVKRLLPGQILRYDVKQKRITLIDNSRAWVGYTDNVDIETIVKRAKEKLLIAEKRCFVDNKVNSVLFSAGWDSRLILSLMVKNYKNEQIKCYFHGDVKSRERIIATDICSSTGVECLVEALDRTIYEIDFLKSSFEKVENVVFPHFHRAGKILKECGVNAGSCGVFGEMLGGKYGWRMMAGSLGKAGFFVSNLLGKKKITAKEHRHAFEEVKNKIGLKKLAKPWYFEQAHWNTLSNIKEEINGDIDFELDRLRCRGVYTKDQIYEAYITEHRATYHTMAQLLSLRSNIDIINVFCDKDFFIYASQIPMEIKFHNRITKRVIRDIFPNMLNFPTSAILVSGKRNVLVQEGSRVLRKIYEDTIWKRHFNSKGLIEPPHFSWPNFEFLRSGETLQDLVNDFKCPVFDKIAILRLINDAKYFRYKTPMHPILSQLLKIYTADLMLR